MKMTMVYSGLKELTITYCNNAIFTFLNTVLLLHPPFLIWTAINMEVHAKFIFIITTKKSINAYVWCMQLLMCTLKRQTIHIIFYMIYKKVRDFFNKISHISIGKLTIKHVMIAISLFNSRLRFNFVTVSRSWIGWFSHQGNRCQSDDSIRRKDVWRILKIREGHPSDIAGQINLLPWH